MAQKLDLLLVNPSNKTQTYGKLSISLSAIEPPIWTGLIAAFIREKGFSVRIIDADAQGWGPEYTAKKVIEYNPLLIGIGTLGANPSASSTPKMVAASKVLNILKNKAPYIKTILYGIHPSALPERTLREEKVDFLCRGESFYTILRLLEVLKPGLQVKDYEIKGLWYTGDNGIVANGWGKLVQDLNELPFIAWDLLPMDKYRAHNWHCFEHLDQRKPYAVIYTSLGCPFNCTFCNIHALYNGKPGIRFRSPKKVVGEIDFLVKNYKIKNIKILDELFVLKEDRVIEFCDLIIKRGYDLNMWAYARIDTVNNKLLKKIKQAGINWLAYGIESGNKEVRRSIGKGRLEEDRIRKVVDMTHDAGIYTIVNFMFGLPDDDFETMQETLNFAKELNCEYANFYVAMAYPGSALYNRAIRKGIKVPDSWDGFSQYSSNCLPLPTNKISAKEVLRFRDKAFYEYFTNVNYLNMMQQKFGLKVRKHIEKITKIKLKRKLLKDENCYHKNRRNR